MKVGVLFGFIQYIARFYGRMDSMSRMVAAVQRAGASASGFSPSSTASPASPNPSTRSIPAGSAGRSSSAASASTTAPGPCCKRST